MVALVLVPTIQTPTLAPMTEMETAAPTLWRPPHSSPTPRPSSTSATVTASTHRTPTRVAGAEEGGAIVAEADDDETAADDDDAAAIDAELADDGGTTVLVLCSALTQVACQEISDCQWKASASMCMAASSDGADDDDAIAVETSTADATADATHDTPRAGALCVAEHEAPASSRRRSPMT